MINTALVSDAADSIGMVGFAVAGLFAVRGRKVDPVGVFFAVFATAFGGGIIRDLLLDFRPFYWSTHTHWIWFCLIITILKPVLDRVLRGQFEKFIVQLADAVGLSFFAVSSCWRGLEAGEAPIVAVLIGVATGVFGGMLRDVFTGRIPAVVSDKNPYASLAFIGCWLFYGLTEWAGFEVTPAGFICITGIIMVRVASYLGIPIHVTYFSMSNLRNLIRKLRNLRNKK